MTSNYGSNFALDDLHIIIVFVIENTAGNRFFETTNKNSI